MSDVSDRDFRKALEGEDELGVVIRGQIHIETQLLRLLALLTPYEQHLENMNLNYTQRVELAQALGLKPQYGPPLKALGRIRNDFAHKPHTRRSKEHLNDLYGNLAEEDREIVLESFKKTKRKIAASPKVPFRELSLKDQFILVMVSLRAILVTAAMEIESKTSAI